MTDYLSRLRRRLGKDRSPIEPCFIEAKGQKGVLLDYGTHYATTEEGARFLEREVDAGRMVRTGQDHYTWTWFGYLGAKPRKVYELLNPN